MTELEGFRFVDVRVKPSDIVTNVRRFVTKPEYRRPSQLRFSR
jgi:hypothetical protein